MLQQTSWICFKSALKRQEEQVLKINDPKDQKAILHFNGQTACWGQPFYLGVTFDKQLTWKQHNEKVEARAKVRLALMKILAGTTRSTDNVTISWLYIGRVRPVLEYGMTAWGTTANSNFDQVSKVHHQRSNEVNAHSGGGNNHRDPVTWWSQGLQTADPGCQIQEAARPPYEAETVPANKGRLQRGSFIHQSRTLNDDTGISLNMTPMRSPGVLMFVPGERELPLLFSVPSLVLVRKTPKVALREHPSLRNTFKPIAQNSPGLMSTPIALMRMQFRMEGQESASSTQEAQKTKSALPPQTMKLKRKPWNSATLFKDALSILQAFKSNNNTDHNRCSCLPLQKSSSHTEMDSLPLQHPQWGCWLSDKEGHNKRASGLVYQLPWDDDRPQGQATHQVEVRAPAVQQDWLLLLTRREHVTVFRLRTRHHPLNYHLYSKLCIGYTEQCPYVTGSQTTEHLLQSSPLYKLLGKGIWWKPHSCSPHTLWQSRGPMTYCHFNWGDWSFHVTNKKKKKKKKWSLSAILTRLHSPPPYTIKHHEHELYHATLQQNDCKSSTFPITLWPRVNIKIIQTWNQTVQSMCV